MPAAITYPALVSETVLFVNKAAAEAFFNNFQVPNAVEGAYGAVKKAAAVAYAFVPLVDATSVIINLDGVAVETVPTIASFNELKNSYITLAIAFALLKQQMSAAGMITP